MSPVRCAANSVKYCLLLVLLLSTSVVYMVIDKSDLRSDNTREEMWWLIDKARRVFKSVCPSFEESVILHSFFVEHCCRIFICMQQFTLLLVYVYCTRCFEDDTIYPMPSCVAIASMFTIIIGTLAYLFKISCLTSAITILTWVKWFT